MKVLDVHAHSLAKAAQLTGFQMEKAISPGEVVTILNKAGISFVLVGAYGLVGWMKEPRATEDVDVVVAAKHHKKAVSLLVEAFPQLEADDREVVTRLRHRETKEVAIDVMKPNQELYRVVFKHTHKVTFGRQAFRVPSLEMALAMKFAPMISLYRADADKYQDAHDFIRMVLANSDIDLARLTELGDLLYSGGGKELVEKVGQVRRGERLNL
jgi:hypothetical protein